MGGGGDDEKGGGGGLGSCLLLIRLSLPRQPSHKRGFSRTWYIGSSLADVVVDEEVVDSSAIVNTN